MLLHYIKLKFREIRKSYLFSFINIGGLILALTSSFLIFLFVLNELSTDRFHKEKDNIYRTITKYNYEDVERIYCSSSFILAENIRDEFPELRDVARMYSYDHFYGGQYIRNEDQLIQADQFFIVDQNFFDIFSFEVIYGDKSSLIRDLNSLVLTESMANKYFPDENPVGKIFQMENTLGIQQYNITGVIKDFPSNSTIQANFLGHIELAADHIRSREWGISATNTFILLQKDTDPKAFENKLNNYGKVHYPDQNYEYEIQSIKDFYFHSDHISFYRFAQGNSKIIITYGLIGFVILLIVSINYIILSMAKSAERLTEIGVKKVMGASKKSILTQMIVESLIISLIAFPISIMLSELALPLFNQILGKNITMEYYSNWYYLGGIFLITLITSMISASYISLYVTSFNPEQIFKNRFTRQKRKLDLRKSLITFQILAFVVLFVFSAIIVIQISFMMKKNIGYDDDNLVAIKTPHDHSLFTCEAFLNEVEKLPAVEYASEVTSGLFTPASSLDYFLINEDPNSKIEFRLLLADHNYIETMDFKLIYGRSYANKLQTDTASIIINQTAAKLLDTDNPVGTTIRNEDGNIYQIIGVVDDFHYESLHSNIPPMGILLKGSNNMVTQVLVKVNPANFQNTLKAMEQTWNNYGPKSVFEYNMFTDLTGQLYDNDKRFARAIRIFGTLAILIASLGIFGFSFYNISKRRKEIGIRKVFGASSGTILGMISKELFVVIIIANILALPISVYIAKNWLKDYAYHIPIPVWIFLFGLIISILIVIISSGITVLKAANQNPSESIRYE